MNIVHTKIGDHYIRITSSSDQVINMLTDHFCLHTEYQELHMEISIEDGYGTPFQNYEVAIQESENSVVFTRADYQIQASSDFKQAKIFVHDELALKHALMNLYSSFIVHHNWGLLIHSSCVLDKQKAHIFSGHSGAGKSTAAKLSAPRELLSDEATIVKITEGQITVYNSPFRSELKATGLEETSSLESIQLLRQSLTNRRVELKKSEALLQMMDKVFYWSYKKEETSKILFLLKRLVEEVPVYELYFQKNNTFWELISS